MQESMAEQQKMIDQLSTQEAQAKAAQRQAMQGQALQTEMQAQAINPKAIKQATMAPMYGQVAGTLGSTAIQAASPTAAAQVSGIAGQQLLNRNEDYATAMKAAKSYEDLTPSEQLMHTRVQSLFQSPNAKNTKRQYP